MPSKQKLEATPNFLDHPLAPGGIHETGKLARLSTHLALGASAIRNHTNRIVAGPLTRLATGNLPVDPAQVADRLPRTAKAVRAVAEPAGRAVETMTATRTRKIVSVAGALAASVAVAKYAVPPEALVRGTIAISGPPSYDDPFGPINMAEKRNNEEPQIELPAELTDAEVQPPVDELAA